MIPLRKSARTSHRVDSPSASQIRKTVTVLELTMNAACSLRTGTSRNWISSMSTFVWRRPGDIALLILVLRIEGKGSQLILAEAFTKRIWLWRY
jgi:hypothetical protein